MTDPQRTDRSELPDFAATDPYWRSALHILAAFGNDGRVWAYVSSDGIDYTAILDKRWSGGERRLLQAGASLWDGRPVDLLDILASVGDHYWQLFLEAAQILRDDLR